MQLDTNALQIISTAASILTLLGFIFAFVQIVIGNRQHRENARRTAAKEAVDIAKMFQHKIIPDMTIVMSVLVLSGQKKFFGDSEKLCNSELRFTEEEITEIFGTEGIQHFYEFEKKIDAELLGKAAARSEQVIIEPRSNPTNDCEKAKALQRDVNQKNSFSRTRIALLNTMEWVAMTLNTKIASEEVIYQSLHQIFLRYVRMEYPMIALQNTETNACDQYYTNIIQLYKQWSKRESEAREKDQRIADDQSRFERNQKKDKEKRRDGNIKYAPSVHR